MRFSAFLMAARMDVVLPLLLLMCFVSRRIGSVGLESKKLLWAYILTEEQRLDTSNHRSAQNMFQVRCPKLEPLATCNPFSYFSSEPDYIARHNQGIFQDCNKHVSIMNHTLIGQVTSHVPSASKRHEGRVHHALNGGLGDNLGSFLNRYRQA